MFISSCLSRVCLTARCIGLLSMAFIIACNNTVHNNVLHNTMAHNSGESWAVKQSTIAYLRLTKGYWQVWLTDGGGKNHHQLTDTAIDITRISWSPDRTQLLCNQNNGQLIVINVADGSVAPLDFPLTGMFDAQWSPDGKRISYSLSSSQNADNNDIWITSINDQQSKKMTHQTGVAQSPSWHPDGHSIVYSQAERKQRYELWQLDMSSGNSQQLSIGYGYKFDPTFNASAELAYAANTNGNYDIWRIDHASGRIKPVTHHHAYDAQPSWSPDGYHIAFYSLRNGTRRIWVKNVQTGKLWSITPADEQSRYPVWYR